MYRHFDQFSGDPNFAFGAASSPFSTSAWAGPSASPPPVSPTRASAGRGGPGLVTVRGSTIPDDGLIASAPGPWNTGRMQDRKWPGEYRFCPRCRTELVTVPLAGAPRRKCPGCGFVHWRNPGLGAAVVIWDDQHRLLMVERGEHSTRSGFWAIPAGFVDYGEEVRAAAARELREETGLIAEIGDPVWVASNFHDPAKLTVGIWFAGIVTGGTLAAGDDASDVGYFDVTDLPPLAFDTDVAYLRSRGIEI